MELNIPQIADANLMGNAHAQISTYNDFSNIITSVPKRTRKRKQRYVPSIPPPKKRKKQTRAKPKTKKRKSGISSAKLPKALQQFWVGCKIYAQYQSKWYECDVLKINAKKGLYIHWDGFPKSQDQWFDLEDVKFCKLKNDPSERPVPDSKIQKEETIQPGAIEGEENRIIKTEPAVVQKPVPPSPSQVQETKRVPVQEKRRSRKKRQSLRAPISDDQHSGKNVPDDDQYFEGGLIQIEKKALAAETAPTAQVQATPPRIAQHMAIPVPKISEHMTPPRIPLRAAIQESNPGIPVEPTPKFHIISNNMETLNDADWQQAREPFECISLVL